MSGGQTDVDMMMGRTARGTIGSHCKAIGVGSRPLLQGLGQSLQGRAWEKGEESGGARTLLTNIPHLQEKSPWTQGKARSLCFESEERTHHKVQYNRS